MTFFQWLGIIIMIIGVVLIAIGIYGLFKFNDFYIRISIASLIDTAGFLAVVIGLIIYSGFTFFSLKIVIIIFFMMLLNPLASHMIVKGAYKSGYRPKKEE